MSNSEKEQVTIDVPPDPNAILTVVFTWDTGMTSYFPYDETGDWGGTAEWYVDKVEEFLAHGNDRALLKLPNQQHKGWYVYLGYDQLKEKLKHIHKAWTQSPLAKTESRGEKIIVPMVIPGHGPGKRGHN